MKKNVIILISVMIGYPIIGCLIGALMYSFTGALLGFLLGVVLDFIFMEMLKCITHGEKLYEEYENIGSTSNRQND